jgi:hypothetical protein
MEAIQVRVDEAYPEYKIPLKIAGKAQDILEELENNFYDSTTIRLNGVQQKGDSITLTVSKARYLEYVMTNYALDAFLREKGWTRSLRDIVHPTTQLCRLEESLLANHIGVGTLVFTADNYLLLPIRPKGRVGIWREEITPSISGATSFDDDLYSFRSGPISSWMREGREELGLENADFDEGKSLFLGITRELLRGGKPEVFFVTQLRITRAALLQKFKRARDGWETEHLRWLEFTDPLTSPDTKQKRTVFLSEFTQLLDQYQNLFAPPLQACLALWFRYMIRENQGVPF